MLLRVSKKLNDSRNGFQDPYLNVNQFKTKDSSFVGYSKILPLHTVKVCLCVR